MRIGVISDTHDNLPAIEAAAKAFKEAGVERVLFAGDFCAPFSLAKMREFGAPVVAVFGNNDGDKLLLKQRAEGFCDLAEAPRELEIGGKRVLLMHFPWLLESAAKSGDFDLIVYGHTHEPDIRKVGGTLIVNPGECGGWLKGKKTIAIVDLERMEAELVEL